MPVLDHAVTFLEKGKQRSAFVPDDEFFEGPPEVDVSGRVPFGARLPAEQIESWRRWLQAGNDVKLLDEARAAVLAAQQRFPVPLPSGVYHVAELVEAIVTVRVQKVVYGVLGGPAEPPPQPVDHDIDRRNFDVGPPDTAVRGFDPGFRALDDATKMKRWQTYLASQDVPPDPNSMRAQRYFLDAVAAGPPAEADRCLDCLRNPGVKWSLVVLALLAGAGGGAYGLSELYRFLRPASQVGTPVGVTARVTTGLAGGTRVTVTWTAPTTGPPPTSYTVTVAPVAGGDALGADVDGAATSAAFDGVADGGYTVTVTALHDVEVGLPATTTVTVSSTSAPPPAPTAAPGPPAAVILTVGLSAVIGLRGVTATWTPPATGAAVAGYTVTLVGVTPPVLGLPVAVGLMTSWAFPGITAGTYRVDVTASNAAGTSTVATSAVVGYSPVPLAPPDAPRNLATHVSGSRMPGGKAALTVTWDRPATGTEVAGYDMTLTGPGRSDALNRVMSTSKTYDPVDDGTFTLTVVTYNAAGRGAAATTPVTVDHTTIDPNGVDWTPVFGPAQITAWKALKVPVSQMAEDDIWSHVLDVLEDKAGVHGGLASYQAMLFVARLLALWIDVPVAGPSERQTAALADQIAAACSPRFPGAPPQAGQDYPDRLAVWRAARAIKNPITGAQVVLRYKLFGLVRALERYLGVRP